MLLYLSVIWMHIYLYILYSQWLIDDSCFLEVNKAQNCFYYGFLFCFQTSSVCSKTTGQWLDRSAMSDRKTLSPQVQWATCAAWHWGSGPHSEGEKTPMVWTCGTLQWCSQDSLWHTGWWKAWAWEAQDDMETADREGLQRMEARPSTLMIDIPGDLVWDLPCVQQASYLEGGPLVWMLPLYLHVNQKSDYDDDF